MRLAPVLGVLIILLVSQCVHTSVIVIGGGLSGLTAARELLKRGHHPVTVVEAKNRLGGRVYTVPSTSIDLGGQNWHGNVPLLENLRTELGYETVQAGGSSVHPGKDLSIWRMETANGWKILNSTGIQYGMDLLNTWRETMKDNLEKLCSSTDRASKRDSRDQWLRWHSDILSSLSEESRSFLEYQLRLYFDMDQGIAFSETRLDGLIDNWGWIEYPGTDYRSKFCMMDLVDRLESSIRNLGGTILLNHRVSRIDHGSGCHITTANGFQLNADTCIVSIPLGVLKRSHSSMFRPLLPLEKILALDRLGVGSLNTVAVTWRHPVCESNTTAYFHVSIHHENGTTMGFTCPTESSLVTQFYLVDDLPAATLRSALLDALRIHDLVVSERDIVSIEISSWHTDPDFLGSYSAPTSQSMGQYDHFILSQPVGASLFFVGEHTNTCGRYQSMDGAIETGYRGALEVAGAK